MQSVNPCRRLEVVYPVMDSVVSLQEVDHDSVGGIIEGDLGYEVDVGYRNAPLVPGRPRVCPVSFPVRYAHSSTVPAHSCPSEYPITLGPERVRHAKPLLSLERMELGSCRRVLPAMSANHRRGGGQSYVYHTPFKRMHDWLNFDLWSITTAAIVLGIAPSFWANPGRRSE